MCFLLFFIATIYRFKNLSAFSSDTEVAIGSSASKWENQLWRQLGHMDGRKKWWEGRTDEFSLLLDLSFVSCSSFPLCISSHFHWARESCTTDSVELHVLRWGSTGSCRALFCGSCHLPGFPPVEALVWFSSLLPNYCLLGKLETSPAFHTWLVIANVLKRYRRRETDTGMMWCPRSHILREKKPRRYWWSD